MGLSPSSFRVEGDPHTEDQKYPKGASRYPSNKMLTRTLSDLKPSWGFSVYSINSFIMSLTVNYEKFRKIARLIIGFFAGVEIGFAILNFIIKDYPRCFDSFAIGFWVFLALYFENKSQNLTQRLESLSEEK